MGAFVLRMLIVCFFKLHLSLMFPPYRVNILYRAPLFYTYCFIPPHMMYYYCMYVMYSMHTCKNSNLYFAIIVVVGRAAINPEMYNKNKLPFF